jgi:hypothetical protein
MALADMVEVAKGADQSYERVVDPSPLESDVVDGVPSVVAPVAAKFRAVEGTT